MRLDRPTVTVVQIETVVARFYAAARADPVLGPVFAIHVVDWAAHEAKVAAFWSGALLGRPGYDGNPMRAHMASPHVSPAHFAQWLELFDRTLADVLPQDAAASWSRLAHRIGQGLRMGVEDRGGEPPFLDASRERS